MKIGVIISFSSVDCNSRIAMRARITDVRDRSKAMYFCTRMGGAMGLITKVG